VIKDEAFIDLELSLYKEINPRWIKIYKRIRKGLANAIRNNRLDYAQDIINSINSKRLYVGKIKKINLLMKSGLFFGASRVTSDTKNLYVKSPNAIAMSILASRQFRLQLDNLTRNIRINLTELVATLHNQVLLENQQLKADSKVKVLKEKTPINLLNVLDKEASRIGSASIHIASSLQMSRVAGYGFSFEAYTRGITTYDISEVMDKRTCPVCRRMDGMTFVVEDALVKLDMLIRITDPEELKLLAPFPKQDKDSLKLMDAMDSRELRDRGWDTPPFHPRCRGVLVTHRVVVEGTHGNRDFNISIVRDKLAGVQERVAMYLNSPTGKALPSAKREAIIAGSIGVMDFELLPPEIKDRVIEEELSDL
jgi:hypothetical protein